MGKYVVIVLLLYLGSIPVLSQDNMAGIPASEIAAYPSPNIRPLIPNDNVLYDRAYRLVEGPLQVFNSPGGTVVQDLGQGYSFVTLSGAMQQGDWAQIGAEKWVRSDILNENVGVSRFAGFRLPDETLPYTPAWILRHLRPSTVPGGEPSEANPFLYRYTVVNLYDYVEVDGYRWYQIGENQWVHQFNVAKAVPIDQPEGVETHKWVSVDLYEQILVAYEGDQPVFSTLISSGLPQWSTNEGLFNVYIRYERTLMSGAYNRPDFYYLEEVPWTMYFDGDIGLHGTYWHDGFGYRQSHGCVNLSVTDAKWLYEWAADVRDFSDPDSKDLTVYVFSSGEYD